jgi:hypothetical protein
MMRRLEEVNSQAVAEIGLSEDAFQRCLMKWQSDPRFFEKVAASQAAQEEARSALMED